MHIGKLIHNITKLRGITIKQLAGDVGTTRENMHKIFHKQSLDTELLNRIAKCLDYDFFKDLSKEYQNQKKEYQSD